MMNFDFFVKKNHTGNETKHSGCEKISKLNFDHSIK